MIDAERILLLISSTLILGYVSGIMYHRTKIPDIVWLLVFGMLLGPALHLFDEQLFLSIFDLMILVTVTMFAFNTGTSISLQEHVDETRKAAVLAAATFITVTVSAGVAAHLLLPGRLSLLDGVLFGSMLAGMSGVPISSLMSSSKRVFPDMGDSDILLQLESAIADPIRVVAVVTLIKMIKLEGAGPLSAARDLLLLFGASSVIGVGFGLVWGEALSRLRERPLNYMMTIASLFTVYVASEYVAGSGGGPISVFLVGVVLMNFRYVTTRLGLKRRPRIDRRKIREHHDELTFFVKAVFFVYLGIIVNLRLDLLVVGAGLAALIIVVRYVTVSLVGAFLRFEEYELAFTRMIFLQGGSTLVLSQFPAKFDPSSVFFANPDLFSTLAVPVVLVSILFSSIAAPSLAERQLNVVAAEKTREENGGEKPGGG